MPKAEDSDSSDNDTLPENPRAECRQELTQHVEEVDITSGDYAGAAVTKPAATAQSGTYVRAMRADHVLSYLNMTFETTRNSEESRMASNTAFSRCTTST